MLRRVPPCLGPRDQCSSKMSPFFFGQGSFSQSFQSIAVAPFPPQTPSISSWGRRQTFAEDRPEIETCGILGPGLDTMVGSTGPHTAPLLLGAHPARQGGKGRAGPPSRPAQPAAAGHRRARSPRSGWGRGPGKGPADAVSAPLPWPGPPRCWGAGGINQDNEAAACHAPRGH